MIIIDASNIAIGGGKVLLIYLINALEEYGKPVIVIWKQDLFEPLQHQYRNVVFTDGAKAHQRKKVLQKVCEENPPSSLLCFGNYPPPMKMECPVYTYFHNPYLLDSPILHLKTDPILFIRDMYLKLFLKNTDYFIFQSSLIKNKFLKKFKKYNPERCLILPIFDETKILSLQRSPMKENRFIYVSYPYKHKNHVTLFKAWTFLLESKCTPKLVVTIPELPENKMLLDQIDTINNLGGQIINLRSIPYERALQETSLSKYVIFPSINETFGLGLIEGALLDCIVLASDLNFVHEVVKPTYVFDPMDARSIAESVQKCLAHSPANSAEVVAKNMILPLIKLLDETH